MRFLVDTHLILWSLIRPERLTAETRKLLSDGQNEALFSLVSLWEVAIKFGLRRLDFAVEPRQLRRALLNDGFAEIGITIDHVFETMNLPLIHRDPFDRLLIAQAIVENVTLLTKDVIVASYAGPIRLV